MTVLTVDNASANRRKWTIFLVVTMIYGADVTWQPLTPDDEATSDWHKPTHQKKRTWHFLIHCRKLKNRRRLQSLQDLFEIWKKKHSLI